MLGHTETDTERGGKGKGKGENSSDRLGFGMFGRGYDILYLGFRFFVSSSKRFLFFLAYYPFGDAIFLQVKHMCDLLSSFLLVIK